MKTVCFAAIALIFFGHVCGAAPEIPKIKPLEPGHYLLVEQTKEDSTTHALPSVLEAVVSRGQNGDLTIEVEALHGKKRTASILTTKDAFIFSFTQKMMGPADEEYYMISTFTASFQHWASYTPRPFYRGVFSVVTSPLKYDLGDLDRFSEAHSESGRFMLIQWPQSKNEN